MRRRAKARGGASMTRPTSASEGEGLETYIVAYIVDEKREKKR